MTAARTPATVRQLRDVARHPAGRPDPERMAIAVVRAYLEVEAGRRPLEQLAPALSPMVHDRLRATLAARRRRALATGRRPSAPGPSIRSIRAVQVTRPTEDTLEASIVVHAGSRVTAVCVRLEAWQAAWRVTELARPEDGLQPIPSRPSHHVRVHDAFDEAAAEARERGEEQESAHHGEVIDLTVSREAARSR